MKTYSKAFRQKEQKRKAREKRIRLAKAEKRLEAKKAATVKKNEAKIKHKKQAPLNKQLAEKRIAELKTSRARRAAEKAWLAQHGY
jgi:hypothetical protein